MTVELKLKHNEQITSKRQQPSSLCCTLTRGLTCPDLQQGFIPGGVTWCGNIMGAFFIGCGTDCRRYTNLTLHIMELVTVSRSSSIHLRERGVSWIIEQTHNICINYTNWYTRRARFSPKFDFSPPPFQLL